MSSVVVFAQTEFLNEIPLSSAGFTTEEQAHWDFWEEKSSTQSLKLVSIAPFDSILSNNQVTFSLPGVMAPINATGDYMEKDSNGISVWWGEISNQGGYVGVSTQGSAQVLSVQKGTDTWVTYPISTRYHALVEIDFESFDDQEIVTYDSLTTPPAPECTFESCQSTIVISVVLTPEAIAAINPSGAGIGTLSGFSAAMYFSMGMQSINLALFNSGVVGKYIRFEYTTLPEFPYGNFSTGNFNLEADSGALDAISDSIRNLHHSDLVVMLTNDRYDDYVGGVNGSGVGIVSAENLWSPRYTFAHEIGHFFGADHNRISNGGSAIDVSSRCNYGYHSDRGYSVMADLPKGQSRFPGFSNPELGTGTINSNNAGHISASMCENQPYYSNTAEASVDINGPEEVCANQIVSYTATITPPGSGIPGVGPYTFRWRLVYNQTVTLQTQGVQNSTGTTFTLNPSSLNLPIGQDYFWIHLTVLSNDGVRLTDIIKVVRKSCFERPSIGVLTDDKNTFSVFPSPTLGTFTVDFGASFSTETSYFIADALGRMMSSGIVPAGEKSADFVLDADPGIYYLSFRTQHDTIVHKIALYR